MKAAQVSSPRTQFQIVDMDTPAAGDNQVVIKVEACGICHGDAAIKEGHWPGMQYPRVPGHEVIGRVHEVGGNVGRLRRGQRVGVGWHGGHCSECDSCRSGDFFFCSRAKITGITGDGGYAEYLLAPEESVAAVPDGLDSAAEAAPLLCAGVTSYNALRHMDAMPGDLVAVHGIGGVGHMAVQYASKMGFRTAAISRGKDKEELAAKLGAHIYIDAEKANPASELGKMGGAKVIFATAPNSAAISSVIGGLGINGKLVIPAAYPEPIQVSPLFLLSGKRSIQGWAAGHAKDSEDALNFSLHAGIRPMVETFSLEEAEQAYQRMITNKVRFRAVLEMR